MSATTCKTLKTHTHTCKNPYLCMRVWVLPGTGTGWPGIPQGYPCYSLTATKVAMSAPPPTTMTMTGGQQDSRQAMAGQQGLEMHLEPQGTYFFFLFFFFIVLISLRVPTHRNLAPYEQPTEAGEGKTQVSFFSFTLYFLLLTNVLLHVKVVLYDICDREGNDNENR